MKDKIKSLLTFILKLLFFVGLLLYIYYSSLTSFSLAISTETLLIQLLIHYLYGLFFLIGFVSLFRKFEDFYKYNLFISPLVPTLFYLNNMLQKTGFSLENAGTYIPIIIDQYFPILAMFYFIVLIFTKYYMNFLSTTFIRNIVGKEISGELFGEFSFIKIYTNYDSQKINRRLVTNIITNLMGYGQKDYKDIRYGGKKHRVTVFTRTESVGIKTHLQHLFLINLKCVDISSLGDEHDFLLTNMDSLYHETINLLPDERYDCFFIYQLYEDGDKIFQDNFTEAYRTFESFYGDGGGEDVIFSYTENYMDSDLVQTYVKLTEQYINQKYNPLIEKSIDYFKGILEIKYSKIIFGFFLFVILFYIISGFLQNYLDSSTITLLLTTPAAIYYSWLLYDKYRGMNQS